jgi:hypothetical protein
MLHLARANWKTTYSRNASKKVIDKQAAETLGYVGFSTRAIMKSIFARELSLSNRRTKLSDTSPRVLRSSCP